MANLRTALEAPAPASSDVLKTTVYVSPPPSRMELVRAWDVVVEAFGDARPPSTLLGVSVLGYTGQLVEIEAVAAAAGLTVSRRGARTPGASRRPATRGRTLVSSRIQ